MPDPAPEPGEAAAAAPIVINSSIPFPEPLKLDGNLRENVEMWKDSFETYAIASGVEQLSERVKIDTFKSALGPEARRIFNLWPLQEGENNTVAACMQSLSTHMIPQKNIKLARYEFNQCRQEPGDDNSDAETMTNFINRARALVKECNYGNLEDEMLRDKIITGIRDMRLKKKMIETDNLTSAKVIEMCRAEEATRFEMERNQWLETQQLSVNKIVGGQTQNKRCSYCGRAYHKNLVECPARGAICNYCGLKNHYEAVCKKKKELERSGNIGANRKRNRKINTVEGTEQDNESQEIDNDQESVTVCQYLYSLKQMDDHDALLKTNITFLDATKRERRVRCILDSGASCNVIGMCNAKKILGSKQICLDDQQVVLKGFGGGKYRSLGRATIDCVHNGEHYKAVFHVVDFEQMPLLSLKTCLKLKLIQLCFSVVEDQKSVATQILSQYPEVFLGLGKLEGQVHLDVDKTINPVVQHPRRIAVTLREELRQELDNLEKLGVIAEEKCHTDWVSNLVLVKRNNKLRVCIDPVMLNKALERPHFQMPTLDELLPELANAKIFTTVDAKSGFWQLELDEESSKLTTCWTPFGRYRWLRMPMGISPAPEVFQFRANEIIQGLRNVKALMDDFMIFGCGNTMAEAMIDHNRNFEAFLKRLKEKNMKLNPDKIKLCQEKVKYFGHILSASGVTPDPDKISSILNMPQPEDVPAVQRFLGMVTYLAHYLPSLSTVAEPLRRLTVKDQPWIWSNEQTVAFERLKHMVTSAPVLQYFDATKDTVIQCDSSSVGLGAVLLQEGQPVVYASKSLSATERRYAQIEKETLAILFACRKFEMYILGRPVVVQTDHLPLIKIVEKPLAEAPLRIQRMLLGLQRYRVTLCFTPGKQVVIADMLSRASTCDNDDTGREIYDIYIAEVEQVRILDYLPISDAVVDEIRTESQKDPETQLIVRYIIDGWPEKYDDVSSTAQVYWKYKHELSTQNGLVLRNDRILIPRDLRKQTLEKLHQSHSGIEATTKLARDTVFWPGITDQIRQRIQTCDVCTKFSANQLPQPMQTHQIPLYPYQKVSMDIFECELKGRKSVYLITVDHYSDYFEIDELSTQTTAAVIKCCKRNFARHGKPQEVSTDGGPQFMSEEFNLFAQTWGFKHSVSAPYHQQANGKAESAVKIAKLLLKKASESKRDFWELLLQWRNTPNKADSSPAQRLFSRRTRFGVPMAEKKYLPKIEENVKEKIFQNRQQAKLYYDRKARALPDLEIGQPVFIKLKPGNKEWTRGTVVNPKTDRSTIVAVGDGEYRRDNTMIKPASPEEPVNQPTPIKAETTSPTLQSKPAVRVPESVPVVTEPIRPRRAIQFPARFRDYEMY